MLYEVITGSTTSMCPISPAPCAMRSASICSSCVITSYSIHYTKLYESVVGVRLADQGIVVVGTTEGALDGSGFGGEDVFMLIYDAAGVEVGSNQEGTAFNDRATAMLISANGS